MILKVADGNVRMVDYEVLVTGGSRGIGKEIVKLYRDSGYKVCAPTHEELDLSSKESVLEFINHNEERRFLILVNNAGVNYINSVENLIEDDIEEMIWVNLLAPLYLIRGLVPRMKEAGFGRIVNIGSIWGVISKPGRVGYSMTKHGIHGITKTLAVELAKDGILVNTVAPGQTLTELTKKNNSKEEIRLMEKTIPVGRLADPAEIAQAVFFLGNEKNTYITGQELVVDGGLTIQ